MDRFDVLKSFRSNAMIMRRSLVIRRKICQKEDLLSPLLSLVAWLRISGTTLRQRTATVLVLITTMMHVLSPKEQKYNGSSWKIKND